MHTGLYLALLAILAPLSAAWTLVTPSMVSMSLADHQAPRRMSVDRGELLETLAWRGAGLIGLSSAFVAGKPAVAEDANVKVVSKFKVRETPNGVKYVDVVTGTGAVPVDGDFVIISYTGYLSDGRIFDGAHAKGKKPLAFKIGQKQVIPGLEEVLMSMQAGGERQVLVPAELAFGAKGVCIERQEGKECLVPPNSPVKYDVILKRVAISPI